MLNLAGRVADADMGVKWFSVAWQKTFDCQVLALEALRKGDA